MKKKDVTIFYGLCMAIYSVGYLTMSAFSSLYLLDLGLSNGAIGVLIAVASMLSVLLQPPVGAFIDKNPKISTKHVLLVMGMLIFGLGLLIIFLPRNTGLNTAIYGTDIMLLMLAQPFLNALGMDAVNYGYPIKFGVSRSMGSMGYALGSAVFGQISVMAGPRSVPVVFSAAFLVLCVLLYFYPVKKDVAVAENAEITAKENPFLFLGKYKNFAIILLGLVLIYFSHVLINTFSLQVVMMKNGTSSDMGTASAIAAVCELITMFFFPVYMKHFALHKLIRVSGIFFTLKIFFSFLVTNMTAFYIIQAFQMFGWGIMNIGIIYYVNNLVGDNDKAQGQAYAGMSYTIASVLGSLLGGTIIDYLGVNAMLIIGTVLAAIGTAVVWVMIGKNTDKKESR